jgi:DNA-binding transcriptional LysR family regulator
MTRPEQTALLARKVGSIPLGLYAHESWIARHGVPAALTEVIAAGSLIGYDRQPDIIRGLRAAGLSITPADFGFRSDSDLAQLAALRAGLGVGICQCPLAALDTTLRRVLPSFVHELDTWLVTHPNLRSVARVRVVVDELAEGLAAYIHGA